MSNCDDQLLEVALNKGFELIEQFTRGIHLPKWLAPLGMVGMLSALIKLLPAMQKGSVLAGIGSYLLVGLLIVNMLALSVFLYLPTQLVTFKSSAVAQTGVVFLKLLLMGCVVMLKNLVVVSLHLVFDIMVLLMTTLTYPPRQTSGQLSPQLS